MIPEKLHSFVFYPTVPFVNIVEGIVYEILPQGCG